MYQHGISHHSSSGLSEVKRIGKYPTGGPLRVFGFATRQMEYPVTYRPLFIAADEIGDPGWAGRGVGVDLSSNHGTPGPRVCTADRLIIWGLHSNRGMPYELERFGRKTALFIDGRT